jgi:hypothetical protein
MVSRILIIILCGGLTFSCFFREEYTHLAITYFPEDSVVILNDTNFYIRKVEIVDNYGKELYKSDLITKDTFKLFSDKNTQVKCAIFDSIKNNDQKKMRFIFTVEKREKEEFPYDIIFFGRFIRMDSTIIISREKRM